MAETGIMAGICTSPYPYPVNAGIPRQNRDGFGQYPQGRIYLPSLVVTFYHLFSLCNLLYTYNNNNHNTSSIKKNITMRCGRTHSKYILIIFLVYNFYIFEI